VPFLPCRAGLWHDSHGHQRKRRRGGGRRGVGEGLREKEWPARCRGHRSRDGELKANDGRRRQIGSDESERGRGLWLRGVGGGSDLGLGNGAGWSAALYGPAARWGGVSRPTAKKAVGAMGSCRPPCRALGRVVPVSCRVVSWARPAAHTLHWPSCRAGTGTLPYVPCRPLVVPCRRAVGRGLFGNIYPTPSLRVSPTPTSQA
jgi:hypothetical protein